MRRKFGLLVCVFALLCLGIGLAVTLQKSHQTYGQTMTFRGKYVCLEHKNQGGTLECGGGFTNGSKVYEIDNKDYAKAHPGMTIGTEEYEVTGILNPPGDFYSSDGIIKITDLKRAK